MKTLNRFNYSLLLVFFTLGLKAQSLESLAKTISSIQYAYEPYTDAPKTMAFRENSLQLQPNGKFHLYIYGEFQGEMAQFIYKDLDFSTAVGLKRDGDKTVITFPKKTVSLRIQLRDLDEEVLTHRDLILFASEDKAEALLKAAYDLVTLAKIEKGSLSRAEAKKDWEAFETIDPRIFVIEHRHSILSHWWFAEKALARFQETAEYLEGDLPIALEKEKGRFSDLETRVGDCEASILYSDRELDHVIILPYADITISEKGVLSYKDAKINYYQKPKGSAEKHRLVESKSTLTPFRISARASSLASEFSLLGSHCD